MNLAEAEKSYRNDPQFHAVVTAIEKWIFEMHITPSEARAAAMLACINVVEALRAENDAAYLERNRLVALLSKLFPSGTASTAIPGWSEDWNGCVYIDFPWGQASWHYHDSQAYLFAHLPPYMKEWDGHTTEQKYAAIDAAPPANKALRAERDALAVDNAALRERCDNLSDDACEELKAAYAERDALAADAARYRWLRDVGDSNFKAFAKRLGYSGAALDAHVDAALEEQEKK